MNLIDLLYGRNHSSSKGKIHLRNRSGDPVTVTKEIRYTVTDGQSNVHINGYDDLSEYCRIHLSFRKSSMKKNIKIQILGGKYYELSST